MRQFLIISALIFSSAAFAFNIPPQVRPYVEKIRPFMEKILGEENTTKILGERPEEINLPPFPKIVKDSKSTAVYNQNEEEEKAKLGKLSAEKWQELNYLYIKELFSSVRRTEATDEDISNWMNTMEQGASREGVYRALVLDDTYKSLEDYNVAANDPLINFTTEYMANFLGMGLDKEQLSKLNLFSIKRITVEKTLETIDAFPNDGDLYAWYAVFSAEMAKKFSYLFKSKLRTSTERKFHYNWAASAPKQVLKSEVIIKMHSVLNSFIPASN